MRIITSTIKLLTLGGLAALALTAPLGAAQADPVATSLPHNGSADWTIANGPLTGAGPTSTTLETFPYTGVWFGWGPASMYGNQPGWTPGDNTAGNYLSLTANFSDGAQNWSAYMYDRTDFAQIEFAPTLCSLDGYCYDDPVRSGVLLYFGDADNAPVTQFVDLDLSTIHTYEFLLKGGQVSYRIDGKAFSGASYNVDPGFQLLVIGDSSSPTPTGLGYLTVHKVAFDNAPLLDVLESTAPEPASWALMITGFGAMGAMLRRRRVAVAA
ncbi:MAG: hypothetical protein JWO33_1034 [Caulobacteraceae bacterium]|nr:hypothetical protein [Caulobacteraceae bacterium]